MTHKRYDLACKVVVLLQTCRDLFVTKLAGCLAHDHPLGLKALTDRVERVFESEVYEKTVNG